MPITPGDVRTSETGSLNRNPQLARGEIQIECCKGAISVHREGPWVEVTAVRGIAGRRAQIAVLDAEELDVFIDLLEKAREGLKATPNT